MISSSHYLRCRSHQTGMTIIELLAVVTILLVLTLIAVPGMGGLIKDARLSSQSDLLVSTLNAARLEAVKQRTNVAVCPAANADTATTCSTTASDWSKGWLVVRSSDSAILQRVSSKTGLIVTNATTTAAFNATFGSASAATSFTLCVSGRKQQNISISASGHVSKYTTTAVCT